MSSDPRFIVDNMLGTIARWLRMIGYDTLYERYSEDWQIIRRAELEDRVIITRDKALHNKALRHGLRCVFLWESTMPDRLAHIALVTGIRLNVDFNKTRCPEDNTLLEKVEKEKISNNVPPRVYKLHSDFWRCPKCGKVYWIGRHWRHIELTLREAREKLDFLKSQLKS
ncbi:MAG: Mut7-C RNAse domain-containing protein [Desulfurococcaceae archaeon]